jgi:hypothetical protein
MQENMSKWEECSGLGVEAVVMDVGAGMTGSGSVVEAAFLVWC